MEAVVASRSPVERKRDDAVRRAPKLLARDDREFLRCQDFLQRMYTPIRHGKQHTDPIEAREAALERFGRNRGDVPSDVAIEALNYASQALLSMHSRLSSGEQIQAIYDWLDRR
jgi:hypothetical protein